MNARVYEDKRRGVYYVQLYWQGKRYWRGHYDDRLTKMSWEAADQIAQAINADISKRKKAFDPRQWFKTPDYIFQFDLFSERWITKNKLRYAPGARTQIERYIRMFAGHFGKMDLREIRKADIIVLMEQAFPSHWQPKTVKEVLGLLHKVFADAFDQELIERIPGFPSVEVPEKEVKWTTREWQEKIISQIPPYDRPIFILMATWGVRPGEARALKWDCVNIDKGVITIKRTFSGTGCKYLQEYTKTKSVRYLPITEELEEIFNILGRESGFVFLNRSGHPYTSQLSAIWNEASKAAGAPSMTLYQGTRHSFATQHIDNLELVQKVLGHRSFQTTRIYQGINVDKIREVFADPPAHHRRDETLH